MKAIEISERKKKSTGNQSVNTKLNELKPANIWETFLLSEAPGGTSKYITDSVQRSISAIPLRLRL